MVVRSGLKYSRTQGLKNSGVRSQGVAGVQELQNESALAVDSKPVSVPATKICILLQLQTPGSLTP